MRSSGEHLNVGRAPVSQIDWNQMGGWLTEKGFVRLRSTQAFSLGSNLPKSSPGVVRDEWREESLDEPSRLKRDWVWVVDPLDGTQEFTGGIPEFAISVGLVYGHQVVAGAILNPATGEGGMGPGPGPAVFWGMAPQPVRAKTLAKSGYGLCFSMPLSTADGVPNLPPTRLAPIPRTIAFF